MLASAHDALANGEKIVTNKTTPSVPAKIRKVTLLVMNFSSPAGSAGQAKASPIRLAQSNAQEVKIGEYLVKPELLESK